MRVSSAASVTTVSQRIRTSASFLEYGNLTRVWSGWSESANRAGVYSTASSAETGRHKIKRMGVRALMLIILLSA